MCLFLMDKSTFPSERLSSSFHGLGPLPLTSSVGAEDRPHTCPTPATSVSSSGWTVDGVPPAKGRAEVPASSAAPSFPSAVPFEAPASEAGEAASPSSPIGVGSARLLREWGWQTRARHRGQRRFAGREISPSSALSFPRPPPSPLPPAAYWGVVYTEKRKPAASLRSGRRSLRFSVAPPERRSRDKMWGFGGGVVR